MAMIVANPLVGPTRQQHLNFLANLERHFIVRNPDGSEVVLGTIPLEGMLVRFAIPVNQTPVVTGTFRVVAIQNPAFLQELLSIVLRMSVSYSIILYSIRWPANIYQQIEIHKLYDWPLRTTVNGLDHLSGPITIRHQSVTATHLLSQRASYMKAFLVQSRGFHSAGVSNLLIISYDTNIIALPSYYWYWRMSPYVPEWQLSSVCWMRTNARLLWWCLCKLHLAGPYSKMLIVR
jgi:hypothetical protein